MKLSKFYIILILLFIVLSAGCREEVRYRLNFNHFLHVDDYEIECTFCHGDMTEGQFAAADMDICVECHEEEVDADDITHETCGKCHVENDLETIGEAEYKRPTRGVFRHSEALNGSCRVCHLDTLKEGVTKLVVWKRSDVVEIRKKGHSISRDCKACHENINPDTPWENHKTNWISRHGMYAAEEEPLCTQCHEQENCRECHQRQRPSSHINVWKWQSHGIEASWDRQKCQLCHQDDFCIACHTFTKPLSHVAGWRTNLHCFNCHISVSNCNVCHTRSVGEIHDATAPLIIQPFHSLLINPSDCLNSACHASGGARPLPPARHFIFDASECLNCHHS